MKRTMNRLIALVAAVPVFAGATVLAGNPDRAGSAGATQLLICCGQASDVRANGLGDGEGAAIILRVSNAKAR